MIDHNWVSLIWLGGGLLLWFLDAYVHFSLKHVFAFAAMVILFIGLLLGPLENYTDLPVLIAVATSITAVQTASYFSGTTRQSGKLYSSLLILAALLLLSMGQDPLAGGIWGSVGILAGISVLVVVFTRTLEHSPEFPEVWILLAWGLSIIALALSPVPWLSWIALLLWYTTILVYIYKQYSFTHLPAPAFGILALILTALTATPIVSFELVATQTAIGLGVAFLLSSIALFLPTLPAAFYVFYLSQEVLLFVGQSWGYIPESPAHIAFWRLVFFLTVNALLVMAESREFESLTRERLQGLGRFRPRIGGSIVFYMLTLSGIPLIIGKLEGSVIPVLEIFHILLGVALTLKWGIPMFSKPLDSYRVLRPSLTTWVLVVCIMLLVVAYVLDRFILPLFS